MEKLGGEDGCCFSGVGSVAEAALAPRGFVCLGSLSLGGGQGLSLAPPCCRGRQGVLEEQMRCKSLPVWGSLFSSRAHWCMQSERGNFGTGSDVGWAP